MNAPEIMKPATKPISLAHKVLLKADDALCAEEIARAILGVDKPSKIDIKSVTKQLKQLADLGMIEMEPRAGGVPFYRLISAPPSVVTHNPHTGTPRNPLDIESDPAGLLIVKDGEPLKAFVAGDSEGGEADAPAANAQRDEFTVLGLIADIRAAAGDPTGRLMQDELVQHIAAVVKERDDLLERMEAIAEQLRVGTIPDLENVTGAEDLAPHVKTLCDSLGAAEIVATGRGHTIDGLRLEVADLRERLHEQIEQWKTDTGRLAADLRGAMEARSHAINEADRLRAELAIERQARKALQEQGNATDVTAAAVGHLVRVTKRPPMIRRKLEAARLAALGAVRAGAARADVLAVVSVGVARRGAEWREA